MPTIVEDAICVRHWDFSETSQTVSLLTRGSGLLRGLAKGAKRERGRFSGGIDLLARGEVVAIVKPGRELATLTDWDLRKTWRVFRERLHPNRAAFYMADLSSRLVGAEDPHPRLFDALVAAFDELESAGLRDPAASEITDVDRALVRFQWTALDGCGFRPGLGESAPVGTTMRFSPEVGVVAADVVTATWPVRAETIALLRALASKDECDDASAAALRRASRLLAAYARAQLDHEPPTMRALFGELPAARR